LVFYDKIKELKQGLVSEKRSIESDARSQEELVKTLVKDKNISILRMELRFNGKRKLKNTLSTLGYEVDDLTFDKMFSEKIAKQLLTHFWNLIVKASLNIVLLAENNPSVLFNKLKALDIKDSQALKLLGALQIIQEIGQGIRGFKQVVSMSSHTYKNILETLQSMDTSNNYLHKTFKEVEVCLDQFAPIDIKDYIRRGK